MDRVVRLFLVTARFHGDGDISPTQWHGEGMGCHASLCEPVTRNRLSDNTSRRLSPCLIVGIWPLEQPSNLFPIVDGSRGATRTDVQLRVVCCDSDGSISAAWIFPEMVLE